VWAKSVIGTLLDNDSVANPSDEYIMQAYREVTPLNQTQKITD
jgi:hypothetical protein